MVFDWVIAPVLSLLGGLFSALPTGGIGIEGGQGNGAWTPSYLADQVSGYLHSASYFFPVHLILTLMYVVVFGLLPAVMIYQIAQWAYRELPDLWGFGPS